MTNNTERRIYQKPPLSVDDQISLLIERGLIVGDNKAEIVYYLTNVSYYHLSIYFKFFQRDDIFIKGTTFEEVLRIYTFDNKLRFLLLELLERIEKSFKSRVARNLSLATHDSHFHTSMEHYINETRYNELQLIFETVYGNSNEISIDHYRSKYTEPTLPPIWTTVEILTFGQVVKFSKALTRRNQNLIARSFGSDAQYVLNWLHCLSALRNTCAHHSRLWNRDHTFFIKTNHRKYKDLFTDNKKLFNYLIALQIILNEVNPTSSWQIKLVNLIDEYDIDVVNMGFPEDWKDRLKSIKIN